MALLHITDAGGRVWQLPLSPQGLCTIGRAPDNRVVLNDPRASRYHAHVKFQNGSYLIMDGSVDGKLSANHVFVNGEQRREHPLRDGDQVQIGTSQLRFDLSDERKKSEPEARFDDKPLGHPQLLVSANDVIRAALASRAAPTAATPAPSAELEDLRRKAKILALLYEMSKTLGSVFDLDPIFDKACEVIFSATPADRVVALLKDESAGGEDDLRLVAIRVRDEKRASHARRQPIGRTITRKVMRERQALLSQDAAADSEFAGVHSIVAQGVHSTICAPLISDTRVHGALYADRLDAFTAFTRDDLELVSAIAAH